MDSLADVLSVPCVSLSEEGLHGTRGTVSVEYQGNLLNNTRVVYCVVPGKS